MAHGELERVLVPPDPSASGSVLVSQYGLPDFFQRFIDSDAGTTLAIFLHTVGVLVFMGGLGYAAFHVWRTAAAAAFGPRELRLSRILLWSGLGANLAGGGMRLAQSGHPTLAVVADNPWVQIILLKHLFWGVLVVLTYALLHRVLPRLVRETRPDAAPFALGGARRLALQAVGVVVLVAVAGASASAVGPEGHMGAGVPSVAAPPVYVKVLVNRTSILYFNGTITGAPQNAGRVDAPVLVPANATDLSATLDWSRTTATLQLAANDPAGRPQGAVQSPSMTRRTVKAPNPAPGPWKMIVSTDQAIQEPYVGRVLVNYTETRFILAPSSASPTPTHGGHGHPQPEAEQSFLLLPDAPRGRT